jgi:hypothetical protein
MKLEVLIQPATNRLYLLSSCCMCRRQICGILEGHLVPSIIFINLFASSLASLACLGDLRERLLPELLDVIVLAVPEVQLVVVAMVMGEMFREVPITSSSSSSMSITIPILCSSTLVIRLLYVPFFLAACTRE